VGYDRLRLYGRYAGWSSVVNLLQKFWCVYPCRCIYNALWFRCMYAHCNISASFLLSLKVKNSMSKSQEPFFTFTYTFTFGAGSYSILPRLADLKVTISSVYSTRMPRLGPTGGRSEPSLKVKLKLSGFRRPTCRPTRSLVSRQYKAAVTWILLVYHEQDATTASWRVADTGRRSRGISWRDLNENSVRKTTCLDRGDRSSLPHSTSQSLQSRSVFMPPRFLTIIE